MLNQQPLPGIVANRSLMAALLTGEAPCFVLRLVEVADSVSALLAMRLSAAPISVMSELGWRLGYRLLGNAGREVLQLSFELHGYRPYTVLLNPNNVTVQTVLRRMLNSGESVVCVSDAKTESVTVLRLELDQDVLEGLERHWPRIARARTSEAQYQAVLEQYDQNLELRRMRLEWTASNRAEYLNLTTERRSLMSV